MTKENFSRVPITIHEGDNLPLLKKLPEDFCSLIYIDPPFNTGKKRSYQRIKDRDSNKKIISHQMYSDIHKDYLAFLKPRLKEAYRVLKGDGSLFFHIDYRESHTCRLLLDNIFGRECLMNEIIWAYDYGGRSKRKWACKHDSIFWYVKDPQKYTFNYDAIGRIPYMAPGLVGVEKAKRGKTPTDVWWQTIVPTNGAERTGYPTQKPLAILERIIKVHSCEGDMVLDFFAGSGTTGEACQKNKRRCMLIDSHPEAISIMRKRLGKGRRKSG